MTSAPSLVRSRMILSAKVIITDHWPNPDRCPICGVMVCRARGNAAYYLQIVGEPPYIPPSLDGGA
ncbi:hypothetical protein [Micromonospora costi]|uniref:Uncharacterized protein n=1 Tax=Micromonospora costi TaxID=1530042 RepID=A0A3B0A6G1_9ACTN|nr:hypothetical protein [Micromonospora costi]RKN55969.1 hypothetical protein D7193_15395 [Micromonospora costi]